MRLIKKDELIEFFNREKDHWVIDPYTGDRVALLTYKTLLTLFGEFEFEVEAIPINWILRYAEDRFCSIECLEEDPRVFTSQDIGDAIIYMVRNWRLENGEVNNQ
jgi:hypothetical protein